MSSTTIPILRYRNAEQAIDWLCKAFDFEVFLKVPGEGDRIEHARLTLETNMVMLASMERHGEDYFISPAEAGGITQALILTVSDPEKIYRSAIAAGARIMTPLAEVPFGGTMFSARTSSRMCGCLATKIRGKRLGSFSAFLIFR
jgi:uncharacterized glyoxalase superfamily protein PhnB